MLLGSGELVWPSLAIAVTIARLLLKTLLSYRCRSMYIYQGPFRDLNSEEFRFVPLREIVRVTRYTSH